MNPAKARPVDFANNEDDLEAAILGEAGWYTRAIAKETGLTESQVNYRLGLAGVKRADYRNGGSEIAKVILSLVRARRASERVEQAREFPDKVENLQNQFIEVSSSKRKPHKQLQAA